MSDEVELISDGDGLAILGDADAVERFIASAGLRSDSRAFDLSRLASVGAATAQVGSAVSESSRWLKVTKESAQAIKKIGLMDTGTPGVKHAMVGSRGDIKQWIQVVSKPGTMVTNPAILAGAGAIMAQLAMQQQMDAITDYLGTIDEKLDAVVRSQTNQVLARVDGVDLAIKEAMSVRDAVGHVSDIAWSKVQHQSATILETQAYALRQLRDIADGIEQKTRIGDLAKAAEGAESEVDRWLAVLAHCVRLHEAIGVLEIDRVLDAAPDEVDRHRRGLQTARRERLEHMAQTTEHLLSRMSLAVGTANAKVLMHPKSSPAMVESGNRVASDVHEFRGLLGIESGAEASDARRWREAAAEQRDALRAISAQRLVGVKRFGVGALDEAGSVKDKIASKLGERKRRRADDD